jgi:hypothetical protein
MKRSFHRRGVLAALAWTSCAALSPSAAQDAHLAHHADPGPQAPSAAAVAALARATAALDRFQDVAEAERAGYRKPGRNDGFQMGEHWYRPDLLEDPVCRLEPPQFLQYLVIDGRRTLIGTGYVCDAAAGPPDWFADATWHTHGPELCRTRKGAVLDASYWAAALPNEASDATWQEVCERLWAEPEQRAIVMLHTWNWIAAPDGPFVHENRAIPFLRAGLRVPARERLDTEAGRDALDTLRLAQGDLRRRWQGALLAAGASFWDHWRVGRAFRRAEKKASEQVERMRAAERSGDGVAWAAAARVGAALRPRIEAEVSALLEAPERAVAERFVASLVVHEHGGP